MYSGEPTNDPLSVSVVAPATWAMPKSVSTTRSVRLHQDVGGLEVTVQDTRLVRARPRAEEGEADPGGLARVDRTVGGDPLGERAAVDQLHDDVRPFVLLDHVVHDDDVRVVQLGDRAASRRVRSRW